ncbi:hypothetical protein Pka01_11290 [Planotetraspora kaengkrachanensis]|uniref:Uncharacterized protein n=1 Tax=Planotetraspora kaengkrachanensis TaxID=575193 RepID=A0A8J3PQD4_9ACTN|nr:hypothetical protein Pka01_11290 [Planotetraspora kaengkrachanensis]
MCTAFVAGVLLATGSGTSADPAPAVNAQGPASAPVSVYGPAHPGVLSQLAWIDDPISSAPDAVALHAPTPQDVVIVWPPADGTVPGSQKIILPFEGHQHASSWSSEQSGHGAAPDRFDESGESGDFDGFTDSDGAGDAGTGSGTGYTP